MSFKRRVLSVLGKDLLLEIGRGLELSVTSRMTVDELRDTLARSKRATLEAIVAESLPRETLKEICNGIGLDDSGQKAVIVERILAAGAGKATDGTSYKIDPAATKPSKATEGGGALGSLLPGLAYVSTPPKAAKGKGEKGERRRGGVADTDAAIAGTLKAALADIDEIVRLVRFPGWQHTAAGEREVRKVLRKSPLKYQLHQDADLFERAYGYIRQYY